MKNKKLIFIIILLLFLTGCSAEYNLKISNNSFKEDINLNIINKLNDTTSQGEIEEDDQLTPFLEEKTASLITNDKFYKKKVVNFEDYTQVKMSYKYNEDKFKQASSVNLCFEYPELDFSDNYYIHLQGEFYCLYSDSIDIKIETKNKVYSNNADEVSGNVYTWHIDGSNRDFIDIEIEIDKGISVQNILIIIIGIILLLGLGCVLYIFIKKRRIKDSI